MSKEPAEAKLNEEQIAELKEIFRSFDRNNDGSLTQLELGSLLRSLGLTPSSDELDTLIQKADTNNNGLVDFPEFVALAAPELLNSESSSPYSEDQLKQLFKFFDSDGDGYITAAELAHSMAKLGHALTEEELTEMITEADTDGDDENSTILAGTFQLVANNAIFSIGSAVNTTGLAGSPPEQTSGTPQSLDGGGGGVWRKRGGAIWGGDAYGSKGRTNSRNVDYGGGGGGRLILVVDRFLEVNGCLLADGVTLMEIRLALHPVSDKLNALTSSVIAKRSKIFEHNDGASDSIETFTTMTSISAGVYHDAQQEPLAVYKVKCAIIEHTGSPHLARIFLVSAFWKNKFHTALVYELLRHKANEAVCWKFTWRPCIPRKFSFILWLALWNRLKTKDRLFLPDFESNCSLCIGQKESANHLFFRCYFSQQVWSKIRESFGFPRNTIAIRSSIKWIRRLFKGSRRHSKAVYIALACTVYHLWRVRNLVIHDSVRPTLDGLVNCIATDVLRVASSVRL
nr:probable calcium-binding protein CML18 [Ipomoea batatas]